MLPPEILDAAVQAGQAAARNPSSLEGYTALGLLFLIVSQAGIWLDKLLAYARARADRKKAEAEKEEAKLAAARLATAPIPTPPPPAGRPGNGSADAHKEFILPHSLAIERHTGEIATLKASTEKLERENREDHGKIFAKLDELKDILIEEERPQ